MHRIRIIAAVLALGIGLASWSAGVVTPALAAQRLPAGTGWFRTWPAAQSAAGFGLVKPTRSYGLKRSGRISVTKCVVPGQWSKLRKRVAAASYGNTPNANLSLTQNNSGGPCSGIGKSRRLGRYQVRGVWAILVGECGLRAFPPCKSRNIFLFLTWRKHGIYYRAMSHDERRATIVGFARSVVPVR